MKSYSHLLAIIGIVVGVAVPCGAQLRDDEASANLIAAHCASSSPHAGGDYADYSRNLARTLGRLSLTQQKRVFGPSLPQVGSSTGSLNAGTEDFATGGKQSVNEDGGLFDDVIDVLAGVVGDFNDALGGGSQDIVEPIIGGLDPNAPDNPGLDPTTPDPGLDDPDLGPFATSTNYFEKAAEYAQKAKDLADSDPGEATKYQENADKYAAKAAEEAAIGDGGNNGHGNDPGGSDPSNPGGKDKDDSSGIDDGNNGHGNDPGGFDPSNPGGKNKDDSSGIDDGNNGHGNDPGGFDPSNPGGKGKGKDKK